MWRYVWLLLLPVAAFAQTDTPDSVELTARQTAAGLLKAEQIILALPDLVTQINTLKEENAKLHKELDSLKAKKP